MSHHHFTPFPFTSSSTSSLTPPPSRSTSQSSSTSTSIRLSSSSSSSSLSLHAFSSNLMPLSRTLSQSKPAPAPNYAHSTASSSSHLSSPGRNRPPDIFDDLFQSCKYSGTPPPLPRPTAQSLSASTGSSLKQARSHSASPRLPVASIISLFNHSTTSSSPLRPPPSPSREPSPSPTTTLSSRPTTPRSPNCCYEITLTDHWLGQQLRKPPPPPLPSRASSRASSSGTSGQLINLSGPAPSTPLLQPTPTPALRKRASTTPSPAPVLPPRRKPPPPPLPARPSISEPRIEALWHAQISVFSTQSRLPGVVVRGIWTRSGLKPDILRKIWEEVVDGDDTIQSLDFKQFGRGIELIDQQMCP
ncbi:hypothetical protein CROQUDRAFT_97646 [Cronartium quercuum f. sp. fusiforme G11]|uniref:EH domain-containing protein n=1 Tax=Cronartium quercuum f. sp. fusiforme G11 TaxID=708437 RepID=A0A9P6NET1_9BASI|nr:hypothetical protein CROQUDRAFT_97646 [Cronartium quercuum f. sp. fusiforme G11]